MANEENLIPAKKGEVRNPKGKPKGTKHWSTIVKQILEDEELFEKIIEGKKNPKWINSLPKKNGANAIVVAMVTKALQGDKNAADWLRKTGFGDKIDITSNDQPIKAVTVVDLGNINADKPETESNSESDQ